MAKIKLGQRPETFKPFPVKFEMPDGTEGVITATFKYRTRKEFGALLNKMFEVAGKEKPTDPKAAIDFEALFGQTCEKNAAHLFESLAAWDVEQDLSLAALEQLADEVPAGCGALMRSYNEACNEGRLGN